MDGSLKGLPRPVNFTYPSEEAEWHADNPPRRDPGPSKSQMLLSIKLRYAEEFDVAKQYLAGAVKEPKTYRTIGEKIIPESLYYFEFPGMFDSDVETLNEYWGELSEVDLGWIAKSRETIKKLYLALYESPKEKGIEEEAV